LVPASSLFGLLRHAEFHVLGAPSYRRLRHRHVFPDAFQQSPPGMDPVFPRLRFLFLLSMSPSPSLVNLMDCFCSGSSSTTWVFTKFYPGSTILSSSGLAKARRHRSSFHRTAMVSFAALTRFRFRFNLLICCPPLAILATLTFDETRLMTAFVTRLRAARSLSPLSDDR